MRDGDQVLDTYVFVGARKVFYQSNKKSADPTKLSFALDVTLNPDFGGINALML